MTHAHGAHLGGARTLDDVRGRCWVDPSTGCWHLRKMYGRPWTKGRQLKVWWAPTGRCELARRLTYMLDRQCEIHRGCSIVDKCHTWDCINPAHMSQVPKAQSVSIHASRGAFRTGAVLAARRSLGVARSKLTPEVWSWVFESSQSAMSLAPVLGLAHSAISARRKQARRSNLFGVAS